MAGYVLQTRDLTGGEGGRQWPAQAHRLLLGAAALAERRSVGLLAFQQQQGLEKLEVLWDLAQAFAQRFRGLPAWGCHVRTSLS